MLEGNSFNLFLIYFYQLDNFCISISSIQPRHVVGIFRKNVELFLRKYFHENLINIFECEKILEEIICFDFRLRFEIC